MPRPLVSPWAKVPARSLQALHAILMAEGAGGGRREARVGGGRRCTRQVVVVLGYPSSLGYRLRFNGGAEKGFEIRPRTPSLPLTGVI